MRCGVTLTFQARNDFVRGPRVHICPSPCTVSRTDLPAGSPTGSVTPQAPRRFVEDHEGIESIETFPGIPQARPFSIIKGSRSLLR
jgi:hypothetical protein